MKVTDCTCTEPGWCERHGCYKPQGLFSSCRRSSALFEAWEKGNGPCLPRPRGQLRDTTPVPPGLLRRAGNFGVAVASHIASGLQHAGDTTIAARLKVCGTCPSCDVSRMVCLEPDCGCHLELKTRWASSVCPLKKWPTESDVVAKEPDDS